ncbi:hypothetical protein [Pseudomonas aeruginosa]|uniref:hypothetical protein n=1 Tax=Pseudomonas aeruginosa TaxID=287 RepID=UPI000B2A3995|nr:hypothetical protein [Pseudomonas aeruginosa]
MSAVERDPAAQATLWRQRVFEVHAAMSAYLAERHRREDLGDWVATSARIFADLPATDDLRAEAWQAVFFRAQALIEQWRSGQRRRPPGTPGGALRFAFRGAGRG